MVKNTMDLHDHCLIAFLFFEEPDVQSKRLQLLYQNIEGLRQSGLKGIVAFHDLFVHSRTSSHVVGFDSEKFLERKGGAVGFHGPDFHFTQALSSELSFSAERLLGDKRVGANGPCMDLVIHQVVEFEHIHDADGNRLIERQTCASVEED